MNAPSMRLPDSWVESLLARMLATYGQKFRSQWADVPPETLRETWAVALGRFDGERIKWALEQMIATCPWPPTLPEFVALCRQAPREEPAKLPAPSPSEQQRAERVEQLAGGVFAARAPGKAWAKIHRAGFIAGRNLMPIQIELASSALGERWHTDNGHRECSEIFDEAAA